MPNINQLYQENIERSVAELYDHMNNNLLGWLSDDGKYADTEDLTPEQIDSISAVQSIEEEWVLNAELREEVSMLRFADDDDDDS
jgi:hypothetical protein